MTKLQAALNSLQNMVLNYRPSNSEIKYQFAGIKEMTTNKTALASIANLEKLVIENTVSSNEINYQFNQLKANV
jgi:hypothetical protein